MTDHQIEQFEEVELADFADECILKYGAATIEDRAFVDFHDGLKPVVRRILYAMYKLGLYPSSPHVKSARVVGDTMGKFHPHGDSSIYSAMVGLANSPLPTVDGSGNWGKINAPAAASRYTNARLSYYAWLNFFNPRYVNVMEYVANYDGKDLEPVVLNGILPNILLNGGSGIATAVTSNVPPLKLEGVYLLAKEALLNDGIVEKKSLFKYVQLNPPYGGTVFKDSPEAIEDFKQFLTKNTGSVDFDCDYEFDAPNKQVIITGVPPGVNPDSACSWVEEKIKCVDFARDAVDKNTPPGQLRFLVLFRRNASEHDMADALSKILSRFSSRENYKINITNRRWLSANDSGLSYDTVKVSFHRSTIPGILKQWSKYRIQLESRTLVYEAKILHNQIARLDLLIFAVKNRKVILESLNTPDPDAYLVKHLKVSVEDAKSILDMKVRQLSKMDGEQLEKELKERKEELAENAKWQKDPAGRAILEIDNTMEKLREFQSKQVKILEQQMKNAQKNTGKKRRVAK